MEAAQLVQMAAKKSASLPGQPPDQKPEKIAADQKKEIALQMLRDLGFEIIDYSYTAGYALPRDYGLKDKLLKIPRWLFFPASNDLTVRVFGGYSLIVLVK